jgi:hypothetical protein
MTKDYLAEMVDDWLGARPNRNIEMLAKQASIGATTLRRIQSGDRVGKPALDVIISVGRATGQRDRMLSAIETHYPHCVSLIAQGQMATGVPVDADTSDVFEDSLVTTLFLSLFTRAGLTRENVAREHGKTGESILSRFVEMGIATEIEGRLSSSEKWYSYRSPTEVLKTIRNLTQEFNTSDLGTEFARMCVASESVNAAGAAKIQSIVDDAILHIRKVLDDEASRGDNVVSVSLMMQRLK